jgi:DNA-binding LacI/PurR family transcriptional regulator
MSDAGLDVIGDYVFSCTYDMHSGYRAVRELFMQSSDLPTAVVTASDILAIGALKFFLRSKIDVPDKIAVIGFDNILLARMYEPSISTIEIPIKEMGTQAVDLLISKLQAPGSKNKQIIMPSNLIIRNSTDKDMPLEFEFND